MLRKLLSLGQGRLWDGPWLPALNGPRPQDDDVLAAARAADIAAHVASIRAIPDSELPDADARAALLALAEAGHECYAYQPLCSDAYTIWLRPRWPYEDGRMSPSEWISRYRASLADAALDALDAPGGQTDGQGGEHAD